MNDIVCVRSNSGREEVRFAFRSIESQVVTANVKYIDNSWSQNYDSPSAPVKSLIEFHDVRINVKSLVLLAEDLSRWFSYPTDIHRKLSTDRSGERLSVSIVENSRLISSAIKPCMQWSYSGGAVESFLFDFLIDQSCIQAFQTQLSSVLAELTRDFSDS